MTIKELAYTLYKIDWMRRISHDRILDFVKTYYDDCKINHAHGFHDDPSPLEALEEFGFDGELYACEEKFLESEYLDKQYMEYLLNEEQYKDYLEDLEK